MRRPRPSRWRSARGSAAGERPAAPPRLPARARAALPLRRGRDRRRRARARDRLLPRRQARADATSACSSAPTSAPGAPAATRPCCARTTRCPSRSSSSARASASTRACRRSSTTTSCSRPRAVLARPLGGRRCDSSGSGRCSTRRWGRHDLHHPAGGQGALPPDRPLRRRQGTPDPGRLVPPPGSVIRHDAVVWGYAAAAQRLGVEVHEGAEVTGIRVKDGRCLGIETPAGLRRGRHGRLCGRRATRARVAALAGVRLPVTTHPLQAFVTEPYKPILDRIVASTDLLIYVSQTSRGEVLVAAPRSSATRRYSTRSTFSFLAECASRCIDLLPFTAQAADPAPVDGPVRHEPRLLADHGADRGRGLSGLDRLGHLGVQGDPGPAAWAWPSSWPTGGVARR